MRSKIIPENLSGKALFDFVVKNEGLIISAKKSEVKKADAVFSSPLFVDEKGTLITKAAIQETQIDSTKLKLVVVINTTNLYDSHGDVHIQGIWKRSIANNKGQGFYLLNSHQYDFDDVIADGCTAKTQSMTWKSLNMDYAGSTEALVFTAIADQDRNPFMFTQYQKGYVKQHSVGMRYIKIVTCINDEDYPVQKENWDKYISMVANPEDIYDDIFWAVLEAQVIEGSAVLFASNCVTPTISIEDITDDGTQDQSAKATGNDSQDSSKSKVVCNNCSTIFEHKGSGSDKCPGCGQFTSVNSTTTQEPAFDWLKAIKETKFI